MSLRQSFLTKRYSNIFYFDHGRREEPGNEATCRVHLGYDLSVAARSKKDYSLSSFHHEFRRERKPDFAEEESVGLLKALRRGRRD